MNLEERKHQIQISFTLLLDPTCDKNWENE